MGALQFFWVPPIYYEHGPAPHLFQEVDWRINRQNSPSIPGLMKFQNSYEEKQSTSGNHYGNRKEYFQR